MGAIPRAAEQVDKNHTVAESNKAYKDLIPRPWGAWSRQKSWPATRATSSISTCPRWLAADARGALPALSFVTPGKARALVGRVAVDMCVLFSEGRSNDKTYYVTVSDMIRSSTVAFMVFSVGFVACGDSDGGSGTGGGGTGAHRGVQGTCGVGCG